LAGSTFSSHYRGKINLDTLGLAGTTKIPENLFLLMMEEIAKPKNNQNLGLSDFLIIEVLEGLKGVDENFFNLQRSFILL